MPKFISCREFLEKKQKQKRYQNCLVRMLDRDEYEHMSFRFVFCQQLLDSCLFSHFIITDEEGITIFLYGDIEL